MDREELKSIIEGLLFVSGDEGLELKQLSEILEIDKPAIRQLLEEMKADFRRSKRGIQIIEIAGTFQLTT